MCLQAIAFNELQESQHEALLQTSVDMARRLAGDLDSISLTELAVEVNVCLSLLHIDANWLRGQMISLSLRMAPYLQGFVHVQTNPSYSYSTFKIIENARRKQLRLYGDFIAENSTQALSSCSDRWILSSTYPESASKCRVRGKACKRVVPFRLQVSRR